MIDYASVLEAVRARLAEELEMQVLVGPLPPNGGLCVSMASGQAKRDMAGNCYCRMRVNLNAKNDDQLAAVDLLSRAQDVVKDLSGASDAFQISGISILTTPAVVQDMVGNYLIVSSIEIRVVFWEV